MSLIRRELPMLSNLSDFFEDDWFGNSMVKNRWTPAVNVVENEQSYEIEVAAPGMKKEDFNVSVENGILIIKARSESSDEEKAKNYTRREFSTRSFSKSFALPENVSEEDLQAKYSDGVLHLTLAKSEKELPAKKEVKIH